MYKYLKVQYFIGGVQVLNSVNLLDLVLLAEILLVD